MTRRDQTIAGLLVLALLAFGIASMLPNRGTNDTGSSPLPTSSEPGGSSLPGGPSEPAASVSPLSVYREGVLGHPSSITPLTARTQVDRDLVALVFRGLVRLGPAGTLLPDVASSWTMDPGRRHYTFTIRPDATWQDGAPVTSADVAFTVGALNDPAYAGPLAGSWSEVTAVVIDPLTVRLDLATPLGGFLQAATLPLLPEHILGRLPVARLGDSAFSRAPVGNGPYRLVSLDETRAVLDAAPAALAGTMRPGTATTPTALPSGSATAPTAAPTTPNTAPATAATAVPTTPNPTSTPTAQPAASSAVTPGASSAASPSPSAPPSALPGLPPQRIELHFFDDASALAAALRSHDVDAAGALPASAALETASVAGLRLVRYPRATLTAVVLNLRPNNPQLRVQRVRTALLRAIDRTAIVKDILLGTGTIAGTPIPPASWAFDPAASKPVTYDLKAAAALLKAEGWRRTATGWYPPKAKKAFTIEIVTPDRTSNPTAWSVAQAVAADWRALGLYVSVVGLPAAEFVNDRLLKAAFSAAIVDLNVGLDPDLYPLFASTQAGSGGSNIAGVQVPDLDKLLAAARAPASEAKRRKAYSELQSYLARTDIVLPLFFRDYLFVASDRLAGVAVRQLGDASDRFWDVLDWRLAGAG